MDFYRLSFLFAYLTFKADYIRDLFRIAFVLTYEAYNYASRRDLLRNRDVYLSYYFLDGVFFLSEYNERSRFYLTIRD